MAMRKVLGGPITIAERGAHGWRLSSPGDRAIVYLRGGTAAEAPLLLARIAAGAACTGLALEWTGAAATASLRFDDGSVLLTVDEARVHEFPGELYRTLPLAQFDARARQFWRWVFGLVRVPGGRIWLKILTRRSRRGG